MSRFTKATPKREYMNIGLYGKTGSGKTLTALLFAEALAKIEGKRIAYIDTEKSTAFYIRDVAERVVHPEAFDIDIVETKSLFEALEAMESLDPEVHGVVVIDSITALWEAAKATYQGKLTSKGSIPVQGWGPIKRPYKKLISLLMPDRPYHGIICGREGVEMKDDEDGNAEVVGSKMKAEGETPYEPSMLIRMIPEREDDGTHRIRAFFEKDRSGILEGKTIDWPTFEAIRPCVRLLAGEAALSVLGTPDEIALRDAEAAAQRKESEEAERKALHDAILDALRQAQDLPALKAAWELIKGKKSRLGDEMIAALETAKDIRKGELIGKVA